MNNPTQNFSGKKPHFVLELEESLKQIEKKYRHFKTRNSMVKFTKMAVPKLKILAIIPNWNKNG